MTIINYETEKSLLWENLQPKANQREWITEKELSELTGLARTWFQQARCRKEGIRYYKFGNGRNAPVRYKISDVEDWINRRAIGVVEND